MATRKSTYLNVSINKEHKALLNNIREVNKLETGVTLSYASIINGLIVKENLRVSKDK